MTRRKFVEGAAVAAVTAGLPAKAASARRGKRSAAAAESASPGIRHAVHHASGIPLGGIGAGTIEIRPDGGFHDWLIFNLGAWAPQQPEHERVGGPDMGPDALAFFLRTQAGAEEPRVRRLSAMTDGNDLYSRGWARNVQAIDYDGRFPVARLSYVDDTLPIEASAAFYAPFIPHDADVSMTPGFYAVFTLKNTSNQTVEVSLLGRLRNPLAWSAGDRKRANAIRQDGDTTFLTMRTTAESEHKSTLGSLGLSVTGGQASWILGEFPEYLGNAAWLGGRFGRPTPSYLNGFRAEGRLPSLPGDVSPARMAFDPAHATQEAVDIALRYPVFDDLRQRMERVQPGWLSTDEGRSAFLNEANQYLNELAGDDRNGQGWGDAALCSSVKLAPGETREVVFTLGWHFPHHFSEQGAEMGHRYESRFADAEEVNRALATNAADWRSRAEAFADALWDTNLPDSMPLAWSGQLSTLAKCTWWTRDGRFAVWEGLGCCGFHTTDITYQGSFNILALFPELQKAQMRMGAEFQRDDGRVHHFFTPDLFHVDNGFDRVDMNPQFVMLAARDYLWTGDKDYLRVLWPHVRRAMASTDLLDADRDGLPDHDTRRNTYDAWDFSGIPAYIASLWLGALAAAERIATELGETADAARFRAALEKGAKSFDEKLWNGEYYSLLVDGARRDECCMSDQLSGQWFTSLMGLPVPLPLDRVLGALKAVAKHNFSPESGLVNAAYPANRAAHFPTYGNLQATANWTGIEYAIASMMMDFGLTEQGLAVVESVDDRYRRAGRLWNHVECGDHYYRAMSSWALLLAAAGFKVDVPAASLTVTPPFAPPLRAPWFASAAWGTLNVGRRSLELRCQSGEMTLKSIRTSVRARSAAVGGQPVSATATKEGSLTVLTFAEPIVLRAGAVLKVSA
jgi:uncharacterized protein (DUF608 family)